MITDAWLALEHDCTKAMRKPLAAERAMFWLGAASALEQVAEMHQKGWELTDILAALVKETKDQSSAGLAKAKGESCL